MARSQTDLPGVLAEISVGDVSWRCHYMDCRTCKNQVVVHRCSEFQVGPGVVAGYSGYCSCGKLHAHWVADSYATRAYACGSEAPPGGRPYPPTR
jgi:hypothetical protein